MPRLIKALKVWLPLASVASALLGFFYLSSQQILRQSANDPQIQMAEDAAAKLSAGASPGSVMPNQTTDLSSGLNSWLTITNEIGTVEASSAHLDTTTPIPPTSSLSYAATHDDNRITWEPTPAIRQAVVIVHFTGRATGYAIAGRSLKEVENREGYLSQTTALTWIGLLVMSFLLILVLG